MLRKVGNECLYVSHVPGSTNGRFNNAQLVSISGFYNLLTRSVLLKCLDSGSLVDTRYG